eukprot:TRINITY_DN1559_c1_g1_i1.p1 TRINITY_DN1559_c1_g1~~TRINITY_DN1559_c1_g1_i1.p1  ORF type:complete len:449 (+),score=162.10 TRINITY_DN1559_c1_g1_i1:79-1347(+)
MAAAAAAAAGPANVTECSVCLQPLLSGEDTLSTTSCGHCYHHLCLLQNMEYRSTCPMCQTKLTKRMVHTLAPMYFRVDNRPQPGGAPAPDPAEVAHLKHLLQVEQEQGKRMLQEVRSARAELETQTAAAEAAAAAAATLEEEARKNKLDAARSWNAKTQAERERDSALARLAQVEEELGEARAATVAADAASASWEGIRLDVLRAGPEARAAFIRSQCQALELARRQVEERGAEATELRERLSEALKYKTRYKELRAELRARDAPAAPADGAKRPRRNDGPAPAAAAGQLSPRARDRVEEARRRVEQREMRMLLGGTAAVSLPTSSSDSSMAAAPVTPLGSDEATLGSAPTPAAPHPGAAPQPAAPPLPAPTVALRRKPSLFGRAAGDNLKELQANAAAPRPGRLGPASRQAKLFEGGFQQR